MWAEQGSRWAQPSRRAAMQCSAAQARPAASARRPPALRAEWGSAGSSTHRICRAASPTVVPGATGCAQLLLVNSLTTSPDMLYCAGLAQYTARQTAKNKVVRGATGRRTRCSTRAAWRRCGAPADQLVPALPGRPRLSPEGMSSAAISTPMVATKRHSSAASTATAAAMEPVAAAAAVNSVVVKMPAWVGRARNKGEQQASTADKRLASCQASAEGGRGRTQREEDGPKGHHTAWRGGQPHHEDDQECPDPALDEEPRQAQQEEGQGKAPGGVVAPRLQCGRGGRTVTQLRNCNSPPAPPPLHPSTLPACLPPQKPRPPSACATPAARQ